MKRFFTTIFCIGLLLSRSVQAQWWEQPVAVDDQPLITVRGEAVVNAPADRCVLVLGIESKSNSIADARRESAEKAKKLISQLKQYGIKEENIQTEMFFVNPYRWGSNPEQYFVRQSFQVVTSKVSSVDELIAHALESGANTVLNVDFETSELRKYRDMAREMAIKAAREKATAMAEEFGLKNLVPFSLREVPTTSQSWYGWWGSWWGARSNAQSQNVISNVTPGTSSNGEQSGGIPPGKIAVRGIVIASFQYRFADDDSH